MGWCHSSGDSVTAIQTRCSHLSPAHLNLPTAPKSLTKESSVDAAHPWSCLGTLWHWGIRSTHHLSPPLEPHWEGAVLELGEDSSGTEEKPSSPSEKLRLSGPPSCPLPGAWVPTGP